MSFSYSFHNKETQDRGEDYYGSSPAVNVLNALDACSESSIGEKQKECGHYSSWANPSDPSRNNYHRDTPGCDREDGQHDLMRIIGISPPPSSTASFVSKSSALGFLTATSNVDDNWAVIFDVCERASTTEANAKEATEALSREFECVPTDFPLQPFLKSVSTSDTAMPSNNSPPQGCVSNPTASRIHLTLSMQLWAVILMNSSEVFLHQCAKREFMDTLEDVLNSQHTSPVVRERLLQALGAAAYSSSATPYESTICTLWRKVKPAGMPDNVCLLPSV
jgi:hypothetical protein